MVRVVLALVLVVVMWAGGAAANQLVATDTTNQVKLGTTNTLTITSPAPTTSRTVTLPDPGTTGASIFLTKSTGTQTVSGDTQFDGAVTFTSAPAFASLSYDHILVKLSTSTAVYGRLTTHSNTNPKLDLAYNWYRTPTATPTTYAFDVATLPQAVLLIDNDGGLKYRAQAANASADNLATATPWLTVAVDGAVDIQGETTFATGLKVPTAGGTASLLDFYEVYEHATQCSGVWSARDCPLRIVRLGTVVWIYTTGQLVHTIADDATINVLTAIPARFRPADTTQCFFVRIQGIAGGSEALNPSCVIVSSAGVITISRNGDQLNFDHLTGGQVGWTSSILLSTYVV